MKYIDHKHLNSLDGSHFGNVLQAVVQTMIALKNTEYDDTRSVELICDYEHDDYVLKTANTEVKLTLKYTK